MTTSTFRVLENGQSQEETMNNKPIHPLQNDIDKIAYDATMLQDTASNPHKNIWVNASAGTGKTKVLTDRVLRLLLPKQGQDDGVEPGHILCLTFTKAGANEMITRIMGILSQWSSCDESHLRKELRILLKQEASMHQIDRARRLFAIVIDMPNGLNITTIHGFCQSLLGQFSMEAGISPSFTVMEDDETSALIKTVKDTLIADIIADPNTDIGQCFYRLAQMKNSDQIGTLLMNMVAKRNILHNAITHHGSFDAFKNNLYQSLELGDAKSISDIISSFYNDDHIKRSDLLFLADLFKQGTPNQAAKAETIYTFCGTPEGTRMDNYHDFRNFFMTSENKLRATPKFLKDDRAIDIFKSQGEKIMQCDNAINNFKIYNHTIDLLTIAIPFLDQFENAKRAIQKLDYEDLILKTLSLLKSSMRQWILYKLNFAIHHIMVDESQDTNPHQWDIIQCLYDDFTSGETAQEDISKTIFVVGDSKQSIFSFQGANAEIYDQVKNKMVDRFSQTTMTFDIIPMNTSFRSTQAILDFVDQTFALDSMKTSLVKDASLYKNHTAFRMGQAGQIDLWPLYKSPDNTTSSKVWPLPLTVEDNLNAQSTLARRIALSIKDMIENDTIIAKNRSINAGDIMVLVRRRNQFVDHLIRELKTCGVPVSGADRLKIFDHIAVQDIMAMMQFVMSPHDDLNLACLLKSPFIGWNDYILESLSFHRDGTLWDALKNNSEHQSIVQYLAQFIQSTPKFSAFQTIHMILDRITPIGELSGWQSMTQRLGQDCLDPIYELLNLASDFDRKNTYDGIQNFVHHFINSQKQIKREMDNADNVVRIMTVHASKGLQAPIVILPDTTSVPQSSLKSDDGLCWVDDYMGIWSPNADTKNDILRDYQSRQNQGALDEYYRLLYVALTRAEDRLIICGSLTQKQSQCAPESWYGVCHRAITHMDHTDQTWHDDSDYNTTENHSHLIFKTDQIAPIKDAQTYDYDDNTMTPLPIWAKDIIGDMTSSLSLEKKPALIRPSQMDDDLPVLSPLLHKDTEHRFRRGNLTHDLLQHLPSIDHQDRAEFGHNYLKNQAQDLDNSIHNSILDEVLNIINSDQFAPFFAKDSMAEVSLSGTIKNKNGVEQFVNGQIDRLAIYDGTVWIVDYKSNRPSPRDVADIPQQYHRQLSIYKSLIEQIYPNHPVRCALLWTDGPHMMEVAV